MLLVTLAVLALAPAPQDTPPIAPPGASADLFQKPYRVGYPVYEPVTFVTLADAPRDVLSEAEKTPVVLLFWSLRDRTNVQYRARLEALAEKYVGRVRFHLIAANHDEIGGRNDDPWKQIKSFVEKEKPKLEILVDKQNKIADDFRVLAASHAFLIDGESYLRYSGGIDNDPEEKWLPETRTSYLAVALEELLEKKELSNPLTRPKGRKLSRHPESPPLERGSGGTPGPAK